MTAEEGFSRVTERSRKVGHQILSPGQVTPALFLFSPTGPTNASVGAAVALAQRAAYRRLIGHLSSEHRSLKPGNTHRGPLEGEKKRKPT